MRTANRNVWWGLLVLLVAGWPGVVPVGAQPTDPEVVADGYAGGQYARIRYLVGGLTVRRAALNAEAPAEINAPLFPGDAIVTGPSERAEIELADGSLVRLDAAGELTFLALPDPYSGVKDNTVLQLVAGSLRVNARTRRDAEFRIDTAATSVYLLGDGDFRIDVEPSGRTRIASRRGVAEVAGGEASTLVRAGTQTEVEPASFPASARAFNTFAGDGFDRWFEEREAVYQVNDRVGDDAQELDVYEQIPSETRPYYRELSAAGRWTYVADYGYAWYPVGVGAGWRPYNDGYWHYGADGYFWVGSEPWAWAPYHYGRWVWAAPYGWCWIPGSVFGGAWVAWSWGPSYVGWAPLDYWNRPAYYGSIYYGYYDPLCWTFVGYGGFHRHHGHHGHHGRYDHANFDDVGPDLRRAAVVTRPPRVAPEDLARSAEVREAAVRTASTDRAARVREVTREAAPPAETFARQEQRVGERRMLRTTAAAGTATAPTTVPGRAVRSTTGRDDAIDSARPVRTEAATGRTTQAPVPRASYPRRIRSVDSKPTVRDGNDPARRQNVTPDAGAPRAVRERAVEPAAPDAPRSQSDPRELYRRMETPRTTVRRPAEPAPTRPEAKPPAPAPQQRKAPAQTSRPTKAPDSKQAAPRNSGSRRQGGGSSATRSRGSSTRRR